MKNKTGQGFTLIEFIVYLGIVSVVVTIAVSLAITLVQTNARGAVRDAVDAAAARSLALVEEGIHAARLIDTSASTFGADLGRLSLIMRDATRSPTVFSITNGRLDMTVAGGNPVPLTATTVNVTRFRLTYLNPAGATEGIQVEMTLQFNNAGPPAGAFQFTRTYVTGAVLR